MACGAGLISIWDWVDSVVGWMSRPDVVGSGVW